MCVFFTGFIPCDRTSLTLHQSGPFLDSTPIWRLNAKNPLPQELNSLCRISKLGRIPDYNRKEWIRINIGLTLQEVIKETQIN